MQSVSSRVWTRVAVSISSDDNDYTTGTSKVTKELDFFLRRCDKAISTFEQVVVGMWVYYRYVTQVLKKIGSGHHEIRSVERKKKKKKSISDERENFRKPISAVGI